MLILLGGFLFLLIPQHDAHSLPSENVVIAQAQTGGAESGTATQEFVLLLNTAIEDIDVSGWCVEYSSASNGITFSNLGCIEPTDEATQLWLSSGGVLSFATQQFIDANSGFIADFTLKSGLAANGGHIRLIDVNGAEVDRVGWGTAVTPEGSASVAHESGEVLSRDLFGEELYDSDDNGVDFASLPILNLIESGLYEQEIVIDLCSNIGGPQSEVPEGFAVSDDATCSEVQLEDTQLLITELLPNAPSYDTGQEFIEIFNPTDQVVDLEGYVLQLGPAFTEQFVITEMFIGPSSYVVFSDIESGLILPNSVASLRLVTPAGSISDQTSAYDSPNDDVSWALIDNQWQYTNQPTPGSTNKPYLEPVTTPQTAGATSVLAPCPAGKFRNPETNRCKNIESAVSQLAPCDDDEYRNPDTNRCRKIATASSSLAPCREGQFRNPDTNRCKSIALAGSDLVPCDEGQERNPETNRCRKIQDVAGLSKDGGLAEVTDIAVKSSEGQLNWYMPLAVVSGAGGYALFEWRKELSRKLSRLKNGIGR